MEPVLLLPLGIVLLVAGGGVVWLWRTRVRRRQELDERIQDQVESWQRQCPVEVLGGTFSRLPGAQPGVAFILLFWNNSGIPCRAATVRLLALREGLDLKPVEPGPPAKSMPLKLLPASALNRHRAARASRPLARMKLPPYERAEVEVAWLAEDEQKVIIQHEVGQVVFPLSAVDYEFVLELTADTCREVLSIGIKRLTDDGRWIASMPRTSSRLGPPDTRRSRR